MPDDNMLYDSIVVKRSIPEYILTPATIKAFYRDNIFVQPFGLSKVLLANHGSFMNFPVEFYDMSSNKVFLF